jgi:hypothetical protein
MLSRPPGNSSSGVRLGGVGGGNLQTNAEKLSPGAVLDDRNISLGFIMYYVYILWLPHRIVLNGH